MSDDRKNTSCIHTPLLSQHQTMKRQGRVRIALFENRSLESPGHQPDQFFQFCIFPFDKAMF